MYMMSDEEIGFAWLKATKEMQAIQLEIAGLESELRRTGEALLEIGTRFSKTPSIAGNIDVKTLSEDILTAGERAKRYSDLLGRRTDKEAEINKFERP